MGDKFLSEVTPEDIEVARLAIEDFLIEMRDAGMSILGRGNGFVVRYRDCTPSDMIRLETDEGIKMAIKAILTHDATVAIAALEAGGEKC